MDNQTDDLTHKRRLAIAWTLIAVAIMCQCSSLPGIAKIFIIFAAAAIHQVLVRPAPLAWAAPAIRVASVIFVCAVLILHSLHRLPSQQVIYIVIGVLAAPLLAAQLRSDLRKVRRTAGAKHG